MIADKTTHKYSIPLLSSSIALILELILIPIVRALPERVGFFTLWMLLGTIIILATIGIFWGVSEFKKTKARTSFFGFLIGNLVLIIIVLYSLAPWLYL